MNLFIGIIMYNFNKSQKNPFLTTSQQKWIELQKIILELKPKINYSVAPKNSIRKFIYNLIYNKVFEILILLIIISNVIVMVMPYEGSSLIYKENLDKMNFVFSIIFLMEALLKIFSFGFKQYFYNPWNKLDFFVVVFSSIDLISSIFFNKKNFFASGDKILRSIRVLRVTRIFKLVKAFDGLQNLLKTLFFSVPKILNILALVFLIFFIYTILGCLLFNKIKTGIIIDDYINFKNYLYGMMTLFKVSTSDQWSLIMWDVTKENSKF